jgi:hypothetical protein
MQRDKRQHNNQPGQTREVNWRWTHMLAVGRQEAEEEGYFYQAVECVFDQICSFGLYVIRYVMFLCFRVQFMTKQTKCFFANVMLNIICLYAFMFLGMLHLPMHSCPSPPMFLPIAIFLCRFVPPFWVSLSVLCARKLLLLKVSFLTQI